MAAEKIAEDIDRGGCERGNTGVQPGPQA